MGKLNGRIALVTGGGSGIGRAASIALAKEGASLVVADIDEKGARETCREISTSGGKATALLLDVTSEESWSKAFGEIDRSFGHLHVLVNNAGICAAAPLLDMSTALWRRQMAVNLDGVFFGTRGAVPRIAGAGGGSIINVSSVAGLKGVAGMSGYCATKGGVRLFTKAVALECAAAKNGVRVNSVHPGAIETPIWIKLANGGELPASDERKNVDQMQEARAASEAATPLGHAGVPADIAAGIVYLASDESRFVTGTELIIDGGVMAG